MNVNISKRHVFVKKNFKENAGQDSGFGGRTPSGGKIDVAAIYTFLANASLKLKAN